MHSCVVTCIAQHAGYLVSVAISASLSLSPFLSVYVSVPVSVSLLSASSCGAYTANLFVIMMLTRDNAVLAVSSESWLYVCGLCG